MAACQLNAEIGRSTGLPPKTADPIRKARQDGELLSHGYIRPATTGNIANEELPPS
jgi:hypothetical protein